jgi:hypothetical protein
MFFLREPNRFEVFTSAIILEFFTLLTSVILSARMIADRNRISYHGFFMLLAAQSVVLFMSAISFYEGYSPVVDIHYIVDDVGMVSMIIQSYLGFRMIRPIKSLLKKVVGYLLIFILFTIVAIVCWK